ncbi:hypothetical protein AMTR_s00246p00015440 [Amborella trichopoda]|uniref:Uncharacterized protein n=1 Tax=Amborella trichopoda TaxID=13333 RepID=W1NNV1_AMBTC|nr:hypothetical protein AMTR_s00246p00015440 [Amborella trichopoda]
MKYCAQQLVMPGDECVQQWSCTVVNVHDNEHSQLIRQLPCSVGSVHNSKRTQWLSHLAASVHGSLT